MAGRNGVQSGNRWHTYYGGTRPMNRLEVKPSKLRIVVAVLLGVVFVPLGLLALTYGLTEGEPVGALVGLAMVATPGVVLWLMRRPDRRTIKYLSDEGLTRTDGTSLAWADLTRVVDQVRVSPAGRKALWRTEIHFKNGESVWLLPMRISNLGEVSAFVSGLPCEHTEVRV
jgi:hypothetical protein